MTLLGAAAGHLVTRPPAERGSYGIREVPGGERLELLAGRMDLPALAEALARDGRPDILARRDGAFLLSRSLVVRRGASLEVGKTTLRLRSEPSRFVGLEARGGHLQITDSTVTSWAPATGRPDERPQDGRAWVLARDGSVLDVVGSSMERLGYARAERYGVAWRNRATGGTISRSTFAGNWYGAYLQGCRNLRIEDSVFAGNAGHGLVVFQGANDVTLAGNEVHDNRLSGIDVNSSLRLRLTGNIVYGNGLGLHIHGASRSVVAEANRLTANRLDGLRVSSGAAQVSASRNLIDFNRRAGVFIAHGSAEIGPANRLLDNEMGVWLSSDAHGTAVMDNSIEANVLDGVHLAGERVGLVRGNLIRGNRKAAFSVAIRGSSRLFLGENQVAGNPVDERLRVEGHPTG
jgi:parallel beta-helix repeat protein